MHRDPGKRLLDRLTPRVLGWAVVLLSLGGCGGGEDANPPGCLELDFLQAITTIVDGDVFLWEGLASCSTVDVAVMVRSLTGIWTVGFDLTYPSSLIQYESYTLGPLLLKDSPVNPPVVLVNQIASGVQVTISRLTPDSSVDAVGAEELITFRFRKVANGADIIDFDSSTTSTVSETILDASGNPRPASFGPEHGGLVTVP
jgi:hypothetical protein